MEQPPPKPNTLQAALHALERFQEQARQQSSPNPISRPTSSNGIVGPVTSLNRPNSGSIPPGLSLNSTPPTSTLPIRNTHHRHSSSSTSNHSILSNSRPISLIGTDQHLPTRSRHGSNQGMIPNLNSNHIHHTTSITSTTTINITRPTSPSNESTHSSMIDQQEVKGIESDEKDIKTKKTRGIRKNRKSSTSSNGILVLEQTTEEEEGGEGEEEEEEEETIKLDHLLKEFNSDQKDVIKQLGNHHLIDRPNLNLNTDLRKQSISLETIYSGTTVASENTDKPRPTGIRSEIEQAPRHRRNSSLSRPSTAILGTIIHYDPNLDLGSPLSVISKKLPELPLNEQVPIKRTLELISKTVLKSKDDDPNNKLIKNSNNTAKKLPLDQSWTLFFSDTSTTAKTPSSTSRGYNHPISSSLKAAEYQSGMSEVFSNLNDVESLCNALIGFKKSLANRMLRSGLETPGNGLGLIGMKPQQNLHFFKVGVNPVWEDPWNVKGGRLTISTTLSNLDPTFESLILLLAGGVIELDSGKGGKVVGIVGSRRSRGDRIEIWLSGDQIGQSPQEIWIKKVQEILVRELGTTDVKAAKFKRHL